MEVIKDVDCLRKVFAHRLDIGFGHVGGYGSYIGMRCPQALPKWRQSLGALNLA
jgi:hypothetical protein